MEKILIANISIIVIVPLIIFVRKLFLYCVSGKTWLLLWRIFIIHLFFSLIYSFSVENIYLVKSIEPLLKFQGKLCESCGTLSHPQFAITWKIIWILCGLIILGYFVYIHWRNIQKHRLSTLAEGDCFDNWKIRHTMRRKIEIRISDKVLIPFTYGIIKPVIVLPLQEKKDNQNLEVVLEHEFIHIKNFDILFKWIIVLTCSLYWYNPVIWVMYIYVNRDIELFCDEIILRRCSPEYKKSYLLTLIEYEERKASVDYFCNCLCNHPTKERIQVIINMRNQKNVYRNLVLTFFITAVIALTILNADIATL